jgi:hypothetical protein
MKKFFQIFFIFFLLIAFTWVKAFSWSLEKKDLSIWELKTSLKKLKEKKEIINSSWDSFIKNNWWIKNFLRKDLRKVDIDRILKLYRDSNFKDDKVKKINFYKSLYPYYVDLNKKKKFFEYIKEEFSKIDKQKNIIREQKEKIQILEKKKDKYEKVAVKKEKYYLSVILKKTITKKIQEKLLEIEKKKSFRRLKKKQKIFLYNAFIDKVNWKKQKLEKKLELINEKKIERKILILDVLIEELKKSIKKFEKEEN